MAKALSTGMSRNRRLVPIRIEKHFRRLGLYSGRDYRAWCEKRGFNADFRKDWEALDVEWKAHCKETAKAAARLKVDRDPVKLISNVCSGSLSSCEISRPRWRALAERIERQKFRVQDRIALRMLVEVIAKRGRILLAEEMVGGERVPLLDGLIALARRSERWVRDPRDWKPRTHNARRQFSSLCRHLFAEYTVPEFLDSAWFREGPSAKCYQDWFELVGQGQSLRRTPAPIEWTSRIAHHFLKAPGNLSVEQACRWGQVIALGGDERLARAVVSTRIGEDFEHEDFWLSVIRFFIRNPFLDPRHVGPIIDYLHDERFVEEEVFVSPGVREWRPARQPNLSMKGRTVVSVLDQVSRWHSDLARRQFHGPAAWIGSGIGEFELETGGDAEAKKLVIWRIRELLSFDALRLEGAAMRHCVATYGRSCASGSSSIWSVEQTSFEGTQKRVTVEVTRNRKVVQIRGRANRDPTQRELEILRRWASQEDLILQGNAGSAQA